MTGPMAEVVDVFEMPPMQGGMLFHTLLAPNSGTYFEQCWCLLEGPLDVAAFQAAWQSVIDRHDILRSECHWVDLDRPVQVIYDRVAPEWHVADWQRLDAATQQADFTQWLAQDRQRGFQLDKAPLQRFALIRIAPNRYRFVWSFHHLLMDGWCGPVLVREMLQVYAGVVLPPAPPPYRRYVDWRAGQDDNAAKTYWTTALAGSSPTPLGIDRAVPAGDGVLEIRETLGTALTGRLKEMARNGRLTLNTLLQGAWALLLARYSGEDDVVFGAVQSGRPPELPGVETMIGLFLNTVPVRTQTDPGQHLQQWLQALQAEQRQRERFGYAPLADIQRWAGLGVNQSLFDSVVIVENYPLSIKGAVAVGGAELALSDAGSYERTHFPLTLRVFPGEAIEFALSVDLARIETAAAHLLIGHFKTLLQAFVDNPDACLGEIELLDAVEREALLRMGRGPEAATAPPVHEQILARAIEAPEKTALEFVGPDGDTRLTYGDLAQRVNTLAAWLAQHRVGRGAVVAVYMQRSPDLVASLLAVMQTGAAYLPIDPDYPAERIAFMLDDAGVRLALTDSTTKDRLAALSSIQALDVGKCPDTEATAAQARASADDLAYILYTSGSTGRPKGVAISHGSLSNFIQSMAREPGISAQDRLLAITTVGFDIAGLELFGSLAQGGTLILADALTARDGIRLVRTMERMQPSLMQATPAGWRMLLEAGWKGDPTLRLLSGGEALDSLLASTLLERGTELWNLYGPTETTIWSAATRVAKTMLATATVPVGGAIDHTQLYVLDQRGAPVPSGIPGELHIGGAGLSHGYWGRPDLTAEKFISNPFRTSADDSLQLYRTGDRVRWLADGKLEFLGRLDGQIKLRGHRIELGEIEASLSSHPMVAQAVAVVSDDGAGQRLIAYVRWSDDAPSDPATVLRNHLATALPSYMLPSTYVALDAFPLTPNGKIDRRALPKAHRAVSARGAAEPIFGEPAATLAAIWCELLRVDHVGPKDNFFELGGHSLLAVTLQSTVRQRLDVPLDIADFFRFPTLETLAAHVASRQAGDASVVALPDRAQARDAGRERLLQRRRLNRQTASV